MTELQKALNIIAVEMFRNPADQDYVCARTNYRMGFREQFLWSGLQTIEKYLKAILLFNGCSARYIDLSNKSLGEFGHNLKNLLDAVNDIGEFSLIYPAWGYDFISYLTELGTNRYFTKSTYTIGDELPKLDEFVWTIRRYCKYLHKIYKLPKGGEIDGIDFELKIINHNKKPKKNYRPLHGKGVLEQILDRPQNDFTRKALIYRNRFYGKCKINNFIYPDLISSANSPLDREWSIKPGLKRQIEAYVKL